MVLMGPFQLVTFCDSTTCHFYSFVVTIGITLMIQVGTGGLAALNPVLFLATPTSFSARPCVRPK